MHGARAGNQKRPRSSRMVVISRASERARDYVMRAHQLPQSDVASTTTIQRQWLPFARVPSLPVGRPFMLDREQSGRHYLSVKMFRSVDGGCSPRPRRLRARIPAATDLDDEWRDARCYQRPRTRPPAILSVFPEHPRRRSHACTDTRSRRAYTFLLRRIQTTRVHAAVDGLQR